MFAARIDGVKAGQHYRFAITSQEGTEFLKADPRARAYEGGESIVIDPRTYAWKTNSFTPPARESAIVYELHLVTVSSTARDGLLASASFVLGPYSMVVLTR